MAAAAASLSSALRFFSPNKLRNNNLPRLLFFSFPNPNFILNNNNSKKRSISFHPLPPPRSSSPSSTSHLDPYLQSHLESNLPPKLLEIVKLFQSVTDSKAKYQQLLHYATKLPPMDQSHKTDPNKVRGCVSQVWVRAFPDPAQPGSVCFEADSDAVITRGLAALLVNGLSGSTPQEVAAVPLEFVTLLGLRQSLTPSRNNGFLNMLKLMQKKALEVYSAGDDVSGKRDAVFGEISVKDSILKMKDSTLSELAEGSPVSETSVRKDLNLQEKIDGLNESFTKSEDFGANGSGIRENGEIEGALTSAGCSFGGRGERIKEKLQRELEPVELVVEDISYQHAGHAAVRGTGDGETHFNVRVVSKEFEGKSMVKRHRLVYNLLQEELQSGLHALSIDAKTPDELSPN